MSKPKRTVERTDARTDRRAVAIAVLDTGKVLRWETEFKPSNWSMIDVRGEVIRQARSDLAVLDRKYGVTAEEIRLEWETRRIERVIETTITSKFDSAHATGGK